MAKSVFEDEVKKKAKMQKGQRAVTAKRSKQHAAKAGAIRSSPKIRTVKVEWKKDDRILRSSNGRFQTVDGFRKYQATPEEQRYVVETLSPNGGKVLSSMITYGRNRRSVIRQVGSPTTRVRVMP